MKRPILSATLLVLGACAAEGADDGYNSALDNAVNMGGFGGGGGAAGTVPTGGIGGVQGVAGMSGSGGTGGQQGAAGMSGSGGVGGQQGTAGVPMSGAGGQGGAGGMMAGGTGGVGGQPTGGMTGGNTAGMVTVAFTTISYGGEYAPLNYGAVWFEDSGGTFIKTAKRWAGTTHASDLVAWTEASGGWGSIFGGGNTADMMDAISMATIRTHQMHTVTWDMMNVEGELVPDGQYTAVVEMSESRARDRAGPIIRIDFTKGPAPMMVEPPANESFSGVKLSYAP